MDRGGSAPGHGGGGGSWKWSRPAGERGGPEVLVLPATQTASSADRAESTTGRSPIDAFLLRELKAKGLSFSLEADRLTLMRRAYFDLTGLPPDPEEVEAYQKDSSPNAYKRLIDRLLESPHYGERWGRLWLDAAGYADSEGGAGGDLVRTHAYRYRDYVIRSLNADKPYDQFLLEQIAGDELFDYKAAADLTPEQLDYLVATGFLRMTIDPTHSHDVNFVPDRLDTVAAQVEMLSSAVMGLTMGCARCHSHKFDPLPSGTTTDSALSCEPLTTPMTGLYRKSSRGLPSRENPMVRSAFWQWFPNVNVKNKKWRPITPPFKGRSIG